jgi:general secretion pathway protein D
LALNNKESFIYVGEKISMQTSSSVTDGGTQRTNYEREDIGLTLKVKPRVSSDVKLTLEINTLLENLKVRSVGTSNPDTLKKEINTTAILSNGESVIIGGLIENKNEIVEEKVPVLGDIPVLGELFKNESNLNRKNNLVIIVTPYIIQKNQDITYIRDKLTKLKALEERYLEESLSDLKVELKSKNEKTVEDTQALQEKKFKDFFEQQ